MPQPRKVNNGDDTELFFMNILIVDDEPYNVALMEKIVRRAGYTKIHGTTDPRRTMALCEQHNPDLILLDLRMPHLDGFEIMQRLNKSNRHQSIPVIILTAENSTENRMLALDAGAKDIIGKPFDRNEILKRIHNALETRLLYNRLLTQNRNLDQIVRERTQALQKEQQRLNELNDHLEELVYARTQALEQSNAELERANNAMSELVSIVSHELRTPLTSIKSLAEILRDETDSLEPAQTHKFLDIINRESDRLNRLITDLLDLQKIQAGKMTWNAEPVNLEKVLQDSADIFRTAFTKKNLCLDLSMEPDSYLALTDEDKARQVVINILSNAFKFTEAGGVTIHARKTNQWGKILLLSHDSEVEKQLIDTFNSINIQVITCRDGDQAVTMLHESGNSIDMAIIDLCAPTLAVDALEMIRKEFPAFPIATMINTPIETNETRRTASELNHDINSNVRIGTIKKPFSTPRDVPMIRSLYKELTNLDSGRRMIDIAIGDSGTGIPAGELSNIFTQFHQVDLSQKRERNGTGLGLAICREIIGHYGGKIWVDSRLGEGSTFHVLLPEISQQTSGNQNSNLQA